MSWRRAFAVLSMSAACSCAPLGAPAPATLSDGQYVMGTLFEVTLHGPDEAEVARLRDTIFAQAVALDEALSRYRPDSAVSRINAAAGGEAVATPPEVVGLLRRSIGYRRLTRGSFDITVGPLVELWMRAAAQDRRPSPSALGEARSRVGADRIEIDAKGRVRLASGMSIDLGGIAKGYALDRMLPGLRTAGVESALLSFGQSSAWALGAPPDETGWRLLARAPDGGFAGILTLRDDALSVSGSLGQWSEIEGNRYGHVLDPRSGEPLTRRREALVVAPDATLAEVLSKALLVLGEGEGIELIEAQEDCEALLLDADGGAWSTSGWQARTAFEPLESQP